ncbi:hypothetical protein XPA_006115 [Xanthoria parietina]
MFYVLASIGALLFISCKALAVPPNTSSLITSPAPLIDIPSSTSTDPGSSLKDVKIQCRGPSFGTGLNYDSCRDAFATFRYGSDNIPVLIGQRGTGTYAHNLPWRWISGDGLCTFDVIKRSAVIAEETTGIEVARSAWNLMNKCVRDQGGIGGIISGIGRTGGLSILIRKHDPANVVCWNAPKQYYGPESCGHMLGHIKADIAPLVTWGPRNVPGVDRELPSTFGAAPPYNCQLRIMGIAPNTIDKMSYYDMWQTASALAGMCARFGKTGTHRHLGTKRHLWMQLSDGRSAGISKATPMANGTVVLGER